MTKKDRIEIFKKALDKPCSFDEIIKIKTEFMKGIEYELLLECISKNATANPKIKGRMTAKEKARAIVNEHIRILQKTDSCFGECKNLVACQLMWYGCEEWLKYAKEFALIACEEAIGAIPFDMPHRQDKVFWEDVKDEIKKL